MRRSQVSDGAERHCEGDLHTYIETGGGDELVNIINYKHILSMIQFV